MKICVVGAGAIGGLLGVRFAGQGHEVTLVARGANLRAIVQNGMRLKWSDGREIHARDVRATDALAELEPQDLVILGMRAHQVQAVARDVPRVLHEDTIVLPTQNGIPWWYFQRLPAWAEHTTLAGLAGRRVESVDPGGVIAESIDPARLIDQRAHPFHACRHLPVPAYP